ncbi:MAG: formylglycine-generating enzyme family protein [Cyanobacteria bacterium P01_D01_bin.116]
MAKTFIKYSEGTAQYFVEDLGNGVELEMVLIPKGTFIMGAPENEECSLDSERPQHEVTVPTFLMGRYQVTQAQWKAVANLTQVERKLQPKPSEFKGDNLPVEQVSWYDAVEFCNRLSKHTSRNYRLPSEAEWEYACRAGTTIPQRGSPVAPGGNPHDRADSPFHFGGTITTDLANYRGTVSYGMRSKGICREKTTPVGSFDVANAFGLYDMHGNVWEWCLDDLHYNYEGAPTDGSAWFNDENNNLYQRYGKAVLRGGSWNDLPAYCRSAYRLNNNAAERDNIDCDGGFRVVCAFGRSLE